MSHYEISIQVNLKPIHGTPTHNEPASGDMVLYGVLPNQAAIDDVMARLYELGVDLVLANVHSERASDFARRLRPECLPLN